MTRTRVPARVAILLAAMALLVTCIVASLMWGFLIISVSTVWYPLWNSGDSAESYSGNGLWLTCTVVGIIVGMSLAVSGSIMQAITRNPLCSPDIIGFTMGAQIGILMAVLFFGGTLVAVSTAAFIGGVLTGGLIFVLSFRGGLFGMCLVLAGIAISAMLAPFNRWLILKVDRDQAYGALRAVTGTLGSAEWTVTVALGGVYFMDLLLCQAKKIER